MKDRSLSSVTAFLPRSNRLLISWLKSPSAVILEPKKIKSVTVSIVSSSVCHEMMGLDALIFVFWILSFKPAFSLVSRERLHSCCCCCYLASVVSDSVQPHRQQPTRLLLSWDFPGKNTGVGCHFLLQCVKVKSLSCVQLLATPWTTAYQAPPSMGFPGKNTGVGCHCLLHCIVRQGYMIRIKAVTVLHSSARFQEGGVVCRVLGGRCSGFLILMSLSGPLILPQWFIGCSSFD